MRQQKNAAPSFVEAQHGNFEAPGIGHGWQQPVDMKPTNPALSRREVVALCVLLWILAVVFGAYGTWLLVQGVSTTGGLSLASGLLCAAAGIGIFRMKRWGAALFGLLSVLGSVNYLSNTLQRFSDLSQAGLGTVLAALLSLVAAILVPVGLLYLTLVLWRHSH